jgi:hypothetical protein
MSVFKKIGRWFKDLLKKIWDTVSNLIKKVGDLLKDLWDSVGKLVAKVAAWVIIAIILIILACYFPPIAEMVIAAAQSILTWAGVSTAVASAITLTQVIIGLAVIALVTGITAYMLDPETFTAELGKAIEAVSTLVGAIASAVTSAAGAVAGGFLSAIPSWMKVLAIGGAGLWAYNALQDDTVVVKESR